MRVTDVPRGPALTLSPEAGVATAIEAMRQRARGAAVVVQNHRPIGVVTDREILTQACADVDDLRAIPIGSVMLPCAEPLRESDTGGVGAPPDVRAPPAGTCRSFAAAGCFWARSTSRTFRSGCEIA